MDLATIATFADHNWNHDGGPPGIIFPFVFLLVLGAVIAVTVLMTRRSVGRADATGILRERYARGEIDRDDYRERLAQLTEKRR